jgi:hypothetical protein
LCGAPAQNAKEKQRDWISHKEAQKARKGIILCLLVANQ